jgi:hypothetical protein
MLPPEKNVMAKARRPETLKLTASPAGAPGVQHAIRTGERGHSPRTCHIGDFEKSGSLLKITPKHFASSNTLFFSRFLSEVDRVRQINLRRLSGFLWVFYGGRQAFFDLKTAGATVKKGGLILCLCQAPPMKPMVCDADRVCPFDVQNDKVIQAKSRQGVNSLGHYTKKRPGPKWDPAFWRIT